MNKILTNIKKHNIIFTIILTFLSCLFMYNGYKALSGFIANGFKDGMSVFTIVLCYWIPVFSYLFYFFDHHVKELNKIVRIIYSSVFLLLYLFTLTQVFIYIPLYASNHKLGAYQTLLQIGLGFPYDGIIICLVLILAQIYNIFITIKPESKYNVKENFVNYDIIKTNIAEYIALCIIGILAFVFVGSFLIGFKSILNALYDPKYLYLLIFVLTPMMNLVYLVIKPETKNYRSLFIPIVINITLGLLLLIFELISPSFIVAVGKPLFPITFSISLPIECLIILVIMAISIILFTLKIVLKLKKK